MSNLGFDYCQLLARPAARCQLSMEFALEETTRLPSNHSVQVHRRERNAQAVADNNIASSNADGIVEQSRVSGLQHNAAPSPSSPGFYADNLNLSLPPVDEVGTSLLYQRYFIF